MKILLTAVVAFALGIVCGTVLEEENMKIDVCADQTSSHYVEDDRAREIVCKKIWPEITK